MYFAGIRGACPHGHGKKGSPYLHEVGKEEVLRRRIGQNEFDAIQLCRDYVEAQRAYSLEKHDGAIVNQFAQRVISTPGKQVGLAWRAADGTWQGPMGESIARFISEGYTERHEPFHGCYFRILKGQCPAAPLGAMDFMVEGAMLGGFGLVAARRHRRSSSSRRWSDTTPTLRGGSCRIHDWTADGSELDQAVLDGEVDQLGAGVQAQRLHHLVFVKLGGPGRYRK